MDADERNPDTALPDNPGLSSPQPSPVPIAPDPGAGAPKSDIPEHITEKHIKKWIETGKTSKLIKAYPYIEHYSIRKSAIKGLSQLCREHSTVDPLIYVAARESDPRVHRQIIQIIRDIGREKVSMKFSLQKLKPDFQRDILIVLGELRPKKLLPQITECLNSVDALIRALAVSALGQYKPESADNVQPIADRLKNDSHPDVRLAAAKALAAIGTREAERAFSRATVTGQHKPAIMEQKKILRQKAKEDDAKRQANEKEIATPSFMEGIKPLLTPKNMLVVFLILALVVVAVFVL